MAQTYFPFDSGTGSTVTEGQWSKMARNWIQTGILYDLANKLEVYADSTGMQVKVRSGAAWIMGHFYENDAEEILSIAASNPSNPRIDRVVLRLDWSNNQIQLAVLTGTPAASPTPPSLTQSSTIWEISLAQVYVGAAVSTIAAGNVTDERTWAGSNERDFVIAVVLGDGVQTLTTGVKGYLEVPVDCYLTGWRIVADASGSCVIGIWRSNYAGFPPTSAGLILSSAKPTLSSAQKNQNTSQRLLLNKGDWLAFNVESASTVKQVTLSLLCTKVR
jgi:hypothetical protein